MIIKSLHIISFGGIRGMDIDFSDGINVISGANESGKTSAAMFIKFIFYGLSSRSGKNLGTSEKQRYINRETGQAAGYIVAEDENGVEYRFERAILTSATAPTRERIRIVNTLTGESTTGENPGEKFFGVSEEVFMDTCFIRQGVTTKPGAEGLHTGGGAIDNILASADGNYDVTRALKKLANKRRELLSRSGGEINTLKEKRNSLASQLTEVSKHSSEVMSLTSSADSMKHRIVQLEADREYFGSLADASAKIELKKKFENLDALKEQISSLEETLSSMGGESTERAVLEAAVESSSRLKSAETAYETLPEDSNIPDETPDVPDEKDAINEVKRTEHKYHRLTTASVILGCIGILGAAFSVVMYLRGYDMFIVPFIGSFVIFAVGFVLIIMTGRSASRLNSLLDKWDAESLNEIELAVQEKISVMEHDRLLMNEKQRLTAELETAREENSEAISALVALAKDKGLEDCDSIPTIIENLSELLDKEEAERAGSSESISVLRGRMSMLEEMLEGANRDTAFAEAEEALESKYGKEASSLTPEGIKKVILNRDFTENALSAARTRLSMLEEKLAGEGGRITVTPDVLATEIEALDSRIAELSLRHEAFELALSTITEAGESLKGGILPKIADKAASMVSAATGKYNGVTVDETYTCGLKNEHEVVTGDILSRGTSDLTYIAFRVSLIDELFKNERPPVVLDESFAHIDMERTDAMMRTLPEGQYMIFTCRDDEADAAIAAGFNTIRWDNKGNN